MKKKVLFLGQLPEEVSPSQRFRIEAYKDLMKRNGIEYYFQPFISRRYLPFLYKKGHLFRKILAVVHGFVLRTAGLFRYAGVDYVFVQREASPVGPPVFEWIYAKLLRKKLIYDFDDAIWIPNVTEGNQLAGYFKAYWKIKKICSWAHKVSAGNAFLAAYAARFNRSVVLNPTCVDTEKKYNSQADHDAVPLTIGWTGSHSTLQFFVLAVPALKKLEQQYRFRLLVICNQKPEVDLQSMEYIEWNKEREIEDLCKIHIGIMPLKTDAWSEGKCGFKIIQYLSLGIPAVASPVGVNSQIIDEGINGFIAQTEEEWIAALTELLTNAEKRKQFGAHGRQKIRANYSVQANSKTFLSLFD